MRLPAGALLVLSLPLACKLVPPARLETRPAFVPPTDARTLFPEATWPVAAPEELGLDATKLAAARDFAMRAGDGAGHVIRFGRLVLSWGDSRTHYGLLSSSKSIGAGTALGLALADGKVALDDRAVKHHPAFGFPPETNKQTGWLDQITLFQLATHTAGFEKPSGYEPLIFAPGTRWSYSDGGTDWLGECLTYAFKEDIAELVQRRVFGKIGIAESDYLWKTHSRRPPVIEELGLKRRMVSAGILSNVHAMSRYGYLFLRRGSWKGERVLPESFIDLVRRPPPGLAAVPPLRPVPFPRASSHYGLLWWNNHDRTMPELPADAYWTWGLYDSIVMVIPSLDMVIVRLGKKGFREGWDAHYEQIAPFIVPLVTAAR
jgi:CubicO group peptidase (beta-lactamase class C family)